MKRETGRQEKEHATTVGQGMEISDEPEFVYAWGCQNLQSHGWNCLGEECQHANRDAWSSSLLNLELHSLVPLLFY